MRVVRTPEERFENLSGFPFEPHYLEIDDGAGGRLRMHYVDEGPQDGPLILCLHGQPVWSYSFRKMIPPLVSAGHRVIAPDLVGFGRSDKPAQRSDYTYARHVHWMQAFILGLDLTGITFVIHELGRTDRPSRPHAEPGAIRSCRGMQHGAPRPSGRSDGTGPGTAQASRGNTRSCSRRDDTHGPRDGTQDDGSPRLRRVTERSVFCRVFMYWVRHCGEFAGFRPEEIVRLWLNNPTDEEIRAYAAPFPSEEYLQARGSSRAWYRSFPTTRHFPPIAAPGRSCASSRSRFSPPSTTRTRSRRPGSSGRFPARGDGITSSSRTPGTIPRTMSARNSRAWSSSSPAPGKGWESRSFRAAIAALRRGQIRSGFLTDRTVWTLLIAIRA